MRISLALHTSSCFYKLIHLVTVATAKESMCHYVAKIAKCVLCYSEMLSIISSESHGYVYI